MKALAVDSLGSLDKLRMLEVSRPDPGPGEVRVAVVAAAVNPADVKGITVGLRILHARKFPMIMGYDFSGRVDAVGAGVQGWKAGDEVFGIVPYSPFTRWGTFAEYTIVKAATLARRPASVSHETAAAVSTVGLTAYQLLRKSPGCGPGARVLVTGASGGVGSVAIGIVRAQGGQVDAVCSAAHREFVLGLGAADVFDRTLANWRSAIKGPYQQVLDAAGSFAFGDFRKVLAPKGGGARPCPLPPSSWACRAPGFQGIPAAWPACGRWQRISNSLDAGLETIGQKCGIPLAQGAIAPTVQGEQNPVPGQVWRRARRDRQAALFKDRLQAEFEAKI
jgi:NADPH:quinone reductase-like Zn-dependent oxidoreductase